MPPTLASLVFVVGIVCLFYLDRGEEKGVSKALWIPTLWLFFCLSRPLSLWLGLGVNVDSAGAGGAVASGYIEGSPVDRAVFAVIEVAALIVVISRRRKLFPVVRNNWAICLYFLYAALSISWSDIPFVTTKRWIKGIGDIMMVIIVLTEPSASDAIERVLTRLGFVLLPVSLLFVRYYPLLGRRITLSWTSEPVGVATQKNSLGELCVVLGIGILWRLRSAYSDKGKSRRRRLLALSVVLGMAIWLLQMCNSMTSICALSMASAVMLLSTMGNFRRRPALVHLLIAAVLLCTVYALFFSSGSVLEDLGRNSTLTGRTEAWHLLLTFPNNRLVGAGYESFWSGPRIEKLWEYFPGWHIQESHNGYVEMIVNLGWIGMAVLAALIATGYRNVMASYRRDPDGGILRIGYFIAAIVTSFTEAAFRFMSPPWIVFLLAITAVPEYAVRKTARRSRLGGQAKEAVAGAQVEAVEFYRSVTQG